MLAAVRANPQCKTTALVATDAVQEVIGDRWAALRCIADVRRGAMRRNTVARAAAVYCSDGDINHMIQDTLIRLTSRPVPHPGMTLIVPGSCQVCVREWSKALSKTPGATLVYGYTMYPEVRRFAPPAGTPEVIVVGSLVILAYARALGLIRLGL